MNEEQDKINEVKEWTEMVQDFMNTMLHHTHCLKCSEPMPTGVSTRDGRCPQCQGKAKEAEANMFPKQPVQ